MYDLVLFPPGRLSSKLRSVNRMYWNLQIILKFVFQENQTKPKTFHQVQLYQK